MEDKIVTFGEVMLRWSKNDRLRLSQGTQFNGNYGGSEANVAVSLATLGNHVEYVTRLPDNQMARACRDTLRYYGLHLNHVVTGGDRLGTYYFEEAAAMRVSSVVYDRKNSSFYSLQPGMIDWQSIFADATVFHCSGITCAISQSAADATFEAVRKADERGLHITCDINYRKNLWNYSADPHTVLHCLMQYSDFIFGDQHEWDIASGVKHIPFLAEDASFQLDRDAYLQYFNAMHEQFPRCQRMLMALRHQITSTHHTFTGVLFVNGELFTTRIYDIHPIIDPMGVGDAFVAAFIHATMKWPGQEQHNLDFALAASALKNTIQGDFNLSTETEIIAAMQPSGGRIDR